MTRIHLEGVSLRQHDESYPFDYHPYAHQLGLRELVRRGEGFVAVNESPTGGGKTSSWLAPALEKQIDTIAVYPTNALVVDQTEQIEHDAERIDHEVSVMTVTGRTLADKRRKHGCNSNVDALDQWYDHERLRHEQVVLLTNPDILVMCARDLYRHPNRAHKRFPFIVVDEFHRAGRKQQNTLCYLLDELYERDNHRLEHLAFLSATPDEERETTFEEAMQAPYHRVGGDDDGNERRPFSGEVDDDFHPVMPPVELDVRSAPTFGTAELLKEEDADETLEFCREGRVAVILDGIHEVERISDWLAGELDRNVERIDGFHSERKAEKLRDFDVLVSNSAVEVGIDFELDRLLFAGHDRASFLQRLGRLRTREKMARARCYVPERTADELATHDGATWTRRELDDVLETIYPDPRRATSFDWRYSAPEALHHLDRRLEEATTEQKHAIVRTAQPRIERHFLEKHGVKLSHDDIARMKEAIDWNVLDDLQWYRGDSIQALVYDRPADELRTYDVFHLLRYGEVEFLERDTFERAVPEAYRDEIDRKAGYVDGFCIYDGLVETTDEGWGRRVAFKGSALAGWVRSTPNDADRTPQLVSGLKLMAEPNDEQSRVRSLDELNARLQTREERTGGGILCYPVTGTAKMVEEVYDLGSFFFLYQVEVGTEQNYSLALGFDALYLHCRVMDHEENGPGPDDEDDFIGIS
jgi:CRISPR-associated endonuclease/helicase Cas3